MDLELLARLGAIGVLPLMALIAVLLVGAKELGFRLGSRQRESGAVEGAGVIVGSILALTAFVLALTLGAATSRLTDRRAGALVEANAIGTAWQQAGAIGEEGAALQALIRDYAVVRLDYLKAERGSEDIETANAATAVLQAQIWDEVTRVVELRGDSIASSLMNATNTMFDGTASARYAVENGLPQAMVRLMFVMAVGAMFALGLQLGLMARPNYLLATVLALFWGAVVVHILDMGTARIGRFGVESDPYVWTLESMGEIGSGAVE